MSPQARVYQIKITLQDSDPPIWRRIQVCGDTSLDKLHDVIQVVMGWTNSHLHQFIVDEADIGPFEPEYPEPPMSDETQFTLRQIAPDQGSAFTYEYDFGDSWHHELLVESIGLPEEQVPDLSRRRARLSARGCGGHLGLSRVSRRDSRSRSPPTRRLCRVDRRRV